MNFSSKNFSSNFLSTNCQYMGLSIVVAGFYWYVWEEQTDVKHKDKTMDKYKEVIDELIKFRNERDWEQFHDSKNLALAISLEAAELNELFLWKKGDDVENIKIDRLKEELADILSFSFLLAEKHNLDIYEIVLDKIKSNYEKYPVDKAKGTAKKYNEL